GLVPVLVVALLWPTPAARAVAALAFLVACITDFLDGWLARRHGMTTALGQLLDPPPDKLILASALLMLAAVPPAPRVPASTAAWCFSGWRSCSRCGPASTTTSASCARSASTEHATRRAHGRRAGRVPRSFERNTRSIRPKWRRHGFSRPPLAS